MQRRYVILAMAAVLVLGIVTPVFSAGDNQVLKRAKRAKAIAKNARDTANQALSEAQQATQLAQSANTRLDEQQIVSAEEAGQVTTTASIGNYEGLGGPSVEVKVPESGMVEVWGQADIRDDDGGAVALFEDGQLLTGISSDAFCGGAGTSLFEMDGGFGGDFETFSTPPTPQLGLGCLSAGAPAPVLLDSTPGAHTYELRYSQCVCAPGSATFRNRILRVAPRP